MTVPACALRTESIGEALVVYWCWISTIGYMTCIVPIPAPRVIDVCNLGVISFRISV